MENLIKDTKADLMARARLSTRRKAVTAFWQKFGEQEYFKREKRAGDTKGISASPEQITVWVKSCSVCFHFDIAMEDVYTETDNTETLCGEKDTESAKKHKEEGKARIKLDEDDRGKISAALDKCTYSLTEHLLGFTTSAME